MRSALLELAQLVGEDVMVIMISFHLLHHLITLPVKFIEPVAECREVKLARLVRRDALACGGNSVVELGLRDA